MSNFLVGKAVGAYALTAFFLLPANRTSFFVMLALRLDKKKKTSCSTGYAMFSGGEKILFFCLFIGNIRGATLAEK
jgi:hypothetical protein